MTVEIVILQHELSELTADCIKSLRAQRDSELTITVIDQASSNGHADAIRGLADTMIVNESNEPIHKVWNKFISESKHDFVCLVNNDTYLADTCISRLVDTLKDAYIAWVSAAYQQDCGWDHCVTRWSDNLLRNWTPGKLNEWASGLEPLIRYYDRTDHGIWMIRPKVFNDIGGFRLELGSHFQDFDYGRRAIEKKYIASVRYDAVYYHHKHKTVPIAVADKTWNDISVPESEQVLRSYYPNEDIYAVREFRYDF